MLSHTRKLFAVFALAFAGSATAMPVLTPTASNGFNGLSSVTSSGGALSRAPAGQTLRLNVPDYTAVYAGPNGAAMGGGGGAGDPTTSVPEPSMLALIGVGLLGLALRRRKR